jgi:hypothetical protein
VTYRSEIAYCVDCGTSEMGGELYGIRRRIVHDGKAREELVLKRRCWECSRRLKGTSGPSSVTASTSSVRWQEMARFSKQDKELTPKQTRAIAALLTAKDVQSAAKEAGVGERTLHTWLDDPAFREALKQAEAEAIQAAQRRLAGTSAYAISVILNVMAEKAIPAGVRLRAAVSILDQLVKLRQYATLEERVAELEARVQQGSK